jgi:cell wall-associated NlpC family hydrolase
VSFVGVHYRNGGDDPARGFDCSGFVWYLFARNGLKVPRTVGEQYRAGRQVETRDARAGDLVFFNTTGVSPSHVGILLEGNEFVHAPSTTGQVRVERLTARYWAGRFVGIRRLE